MGILALPRVFTSVSSSQHPTDPSSSNSFFPFYSCGPRGRFFTDLQDRSPTMSHPSQTCCPSMLPWVCPLGTETMVSTLAPVPTEFYLADGAYRARPWWIPASKPWPLSGQVGRSPGPAEGQLCPVIRGTCRRRQGRGRAAVLYASRPFHIGWLWGRKNSRCRIRDVGSRPASLRRMIRSQDLFLQCEMLCGAGLPMFGESAWGKENG